MIKREAQAILDNILGLYQVSTNENGDFTKKTIDIDLVECNSKIFKSILSARKELKKEIDSFEKDIRKKIKHYFFSCLGYEDKKLIDKQKLSIVCNGGYYITIKMYLTVNKVKSTFNFYEWNSFGDAKVECSTRTEEAQIVKLLNEGKKKLDFKKLHSLCQLCESDILAEKKKSLIEISDLLYYIENKNHFDMIDKLFIPHDIKDIEKAFDDTVESLLNRRSAEWFYTIDIKLWKNHIKVNTYKFNVRTDSGARIYTMNGTIVSRQEAFEIFSRQRSYFYNVKKRPIIRKSFPINKIESELNQQIKQLNIANF